MISSRDDRDQVVYWKYLEFCDRHKFSRNSEGHQVIPVLELAKEGHLSWVEELSYNCRRLSSLVSTLLVKLCEALPQLKMLNLSGTFLGDENFVALCQVLSKCENLRELRLAHCKLKRKSAQVLVQQLRKNCWSHLEVLDVRNNLLSQKDLEILRHVSKTLSFTLLDDGNQLRDEVLNSVTHGVGFVSSIFAGSSLTFRAQILPPLERTGIYIYVLSLCLMFASSTLYHSFFRLAKAKRVFRALDHCSIFILIAGTYTPFVQKFLWYQRRILGFSILTTIWCLAFLGIFLSSGFLELHTFSNTLRVLLAVFMGWLVLGTSKILREEMPSACFYWVLTGGIFYTVGIPFYIKGQKITLYHVLWHLWLMMGACCHYVAVDQYVLGPFLTS